MTSITTKLAAQQQQRMVNLIVGDHQIIKRMEDLPFDYFIISQSKFLAYAECMESKNEGLFLFLEEDFNKVLQLLEKSQLCVRNPFSILWWPQQKSDKQEELIKCAIHGIQYVPSYEENAALAIGMIKGRLGLISDYRIMLNSIIEMDVSSSLNITSGRDKYLMKQVTDYLNEHYSNEELCIHRMGKDIGMSRTSFFNKIKLITGVSPSRFVMTYRLNMAKYFLLEQQENISEVAFKVGFSSTSYFTRCFKELFKITPTKFVDQFAELPIHELDHQ